MRNGRVEGEDWKGSRKEDSSGVGSRWVSSRAHNSSSRSVCARVPPTLVAFVSHCMHARQIYRGELRGEWNEGGVGRGRKRERERERDTLVAGERATGKWRREGNRHFESFGKFERLNKSNGEDTREEMRNGRKGMVEW